MLGLACMLASAAQATLVCKPGRYFDGDTSACAQCAPGKYGPFSGLAFCMACPMGQHQPLSGQTECAKGAGQQGAAADSPCLLLTC